MNQEKILLSKKRKEKIARDTAIKKEYDELIANGSMITPVLELLAKKYGVKASTVNYIAKGYEKKYGRNNYSY
jgi:hypothetical protein